MSILSLMSSIKTLKVSKMETIQLNLGCGNQVVTDWINVDYFIGARLSRRPGFSLLNKKLKLF